MTDWPSVDWRLTTDSSTWGRCKATSIGVSFLLDPCRFPAKRERRSIYLTELNDCLEAVCGDESFYYTADAWKAKFDQFCASTSRDEQDTFLSLRQEILHMAIRRIDKNIMTRTVPNTITLIDGKPDYEP